MEHVRLEETRFEKILGLVLVVVMSAVVPIGAGCSADWQIQECLAPVFVPVRCSGCSPAGKLPCFVVLRTPVAPRVVALSARIVPRTFGVIGWKLSGLGIIVWLFF